MGTPEYHPQAARRIEIAGPTHQGRLAKPSPGPQVASKRTLGS